MNDKEIGVIDCGDHFYSPGRNGSFNGKRGFGPGKVYQGEDAEVLRLKRG